MAKVRKEEESPAKAVLHAMLTAKQSNPVAANLFMRMRYEKAFGIYDHDAPDRKEVPWPLLAISPKESLTLLDPFSFRLEQFIENRVFELTGISFAKLLKWPRRDFLRVIETCKRQSAKLYGGVGGDLKKLEQTLARMQTQKQ